MALEANGRYAVKMGESRETPTYFGREDNPSLFLYPPATQTALHRLSTTFAKERRSIHLPEDHLLYWSTFLGDEHNLGL